MQRGHAWTLRKVKKINISFLIFKINVSNALKSMRVYENAWCPEDHVSLMGLTALTEKFLFD